MVRRSRQSGYALLLAIFMIALVAMAVQSVHITLQQRLAAGSREAENATLQALADAAMAATLAHLARDASFTGLSRQRFGDGFIASRVVPLGGGRLEIRAEADLKRCRACLSATAELAGSGPRVVAWHHGG
jgi:hypothetical protein